MKIPFNRAELLYQWGVWRFTLVCVAVLICMLVFGYQIAHLRHQQARLQAQSNTHTRALLEQENTTLKQRVSELEVRSVLSENVVISLQKKLEEQQLRSRALEEQLSFYQRVVAPEVTQDGFFIDGVQVAATASTHVYRLTAVLLQQNNNKAILRGSLTVRIRGSLNGKPHELSSADPNVFSSGNIDWGFKYFQTVDVEVTLPQGFIPEQLSFATDVYQWKTKRGEYFNSLNWVDVFDSASSEGIHE